MDNISLIFGEQAISANQTYPHTLTPVLQSTGARVVTTVCDSDPQLMLATQNVIDRIGMQSGSGLAFVVANGRDSNTHKPLLLHGGTNDLLEMMQRLASHAPQRSGPLDVFVLTADDPTFVHRHIHKLPAGSTAIAMRTWPDSAQNENFWNMLKHESLFAQIPLCARSLLLCALLGGRETNGLPEIAVSGKPQTNLKDMWNQMVRKGGMGASATHELNLMSDYMDDDHKLTFTMTKDVINKNIVGAYPIGAAFYACAAASTWEHFFGPSVHLIKSATTPAVAISAPAAQAVRTRATTADAASVANTPDAAAPHRRPQLTASQVGRLYKPGVPVYKQHPAVVKRLLHRN